MRPYPTSVGFCRAFVIAGISERRIFPWSSTRMLKSSVLLLLCWLAVGIHAAPITSSSNVERQLSSDSNRVHCEHHSSMDSAACSFHDTCIESTFQCGPLGLALGYAQARCEQVRLLHQSDVACAKCIQNQALLDWVLHSETCFKQKLLHLVQNQTTTTKQFPDPPDCLNFEIAALDQLEQCYASEADTICELMNNVSSDVLASDLKVILDAVTVNSYYQSIVTKQFRDLINSCSPAQDSSLADEVAPATQSMLLCASLLVGDKLTDADRVAQALAEKLNQSPKDFKVAAHDLDLVSSCREKSNPNWVVSTSDYFLVYWAVSPGFDEDALAQCQSAKYKPCTSSSGGTLIYFEYTSFTTSSCGNGLREAGESCDAFVYTGKDEYGCSEQCQGLPSHECTTEHLQTSFCSKTACGDGLRTSDEECDEGASSAGCSPQSCTVQDGYTCESPYNSSSHCTKVAPSKTLVESSPTLSSPSSSPLPQQTPPAIQPLEVKPTSGGLASGAHSIQRTLHLWSIFLTQLLVFLVLHLVWR